MKKIAEVHFDKTLLLVGPINNNQVYDLGMDKMPNIIFGSKTLLVKGISAKKTNPLIM